jgi:acyl-CoA thioester hydrolase
LDAVSSFDTGSVTRMQLRWRDIDSWGHVTHSVYHDFLAEGRLALITARLPGAASDFVIARVEIDYRREVRRDEEYVDVTGEIAQIGGKSLTIDQRIVLPDGSVAAESRSIMVGWDPATRAARELSARERTALLQNGSAPPPE